MSVIGSIVANLSANTESLARDMDRGVKIVETGFARMAKIQAGGFQEGLNVKGFESSLAKIYGTGGGGGGSGVAAALANKAGAKAASSFKDGLSSGLSKSSELFKTVASGGSMLQNVGAVGMALGGWGIALSSALSIAQSLADAMKQVGGEAQDAAKAYADEVERVFKSTQDGGANRVFDQANGLIKNPDWADKLVDGVLGPRDNGMGKNVEESITRRISKLGVRRGELGTVDDFVRAKMLDKHGTMLPHENARDNIAAHNEFKRQFKGMTDEIDEQVSSLLKLRLERMTGMFRDVNSAFRSVAPHSFQATNWIRKSELDSEQEIADRNAAIVEENRKRNKNDQKPLLEHSRWLQTHGPTSFPLSNLSGSQQFAQNNPLILPGFQQGGVGMNANQMLVSFGAGLANANQHLADFGNGLAKGLELAAREKNRMQAGTTWNPFERFQDEMARVKELENGGASADVVARLRGQARQQLDSALPMIQPAFAGLIKANSAEASKAILASMLPKAKAEARPLEELRDEAERQTDILREIGRNTARQFQAANFQ